MYEFGANDSYSLRGALSYFDSSAPVDAETDMLIYPGENGILYLIKLNTNYNPEEGTLSISPGPVVKWHYYEPDQAQDLSGQVWKTALLFTKDIFLLRTMEEI